MNPDILILGGGVSGLSAALELQHTGARVTILERQSAGQESTWAGGGILSPLLPWHYSDAVVRLCHAGAQAYPTWLDALREDATTDPEYIVSGMRVLAQTSDSAERLAWLARTGDQFPLYARQHPDSHDDSLWMPDIAQARNPRLAAMLAQVVRRRGIHLIEQAGDVRLTLQDDRVLHAESGSQRWHAGQYLVAAGAWSQALIPVAPPTRAIRPVRGQMLLFHARPDTLTTILYRQGTYLIPRQDGRILVGSTLEEVGFDKSTTAAARSELTAIALSMLPALESYAPEHHWSGLRPGSPGNLPTIARHPHITNLYANTGHFRYGVTMAPASARLIADIMLDRPSAIDPEAYGWETPAPAPHPDSGD